MGRCCAEKRGLIVRRWRLTATNPTDAPRLFDSLEDLMAYESFPEPGPYPEQLRIDVSGLPPADAHSDIVTAARAAIEADPEIIAKFPNGLTAVSNAHFNGLVRILERHFPTGDLCDHCTGLYGKPWPCADYRDASAGLATGLPEAHA